ncbi:MAG TPA: preprotein translocase subunit SecG [Spirochaetota bacterium]|nr:preprotein translocase subunit SecG [Spirochaetota bacterium]
MEVLILVLVIISFIVCFMMIGAILLQEDKSGGGIGIVGGSSQSFFGANSSSILVRITTVLFVIFMVLMLVIGLISSSFTKGSIISEKDITASETEEYISKKKLLKDAPEKINIADFENSILAKITDEKDKNFINSLYKKDSSNKYFIINDKISKTDKTKVVGLLNSIGFTLEAETTVLDENKSDGKDVENK